MTTTILVNASGLMLMVAIVWWFWLAAPRAVADAAKGHIRIEVAQGAYAPDRVLIPAGQTVQFEFIRRDPSPCAAVVQFEGLPISRELPLETPLAVAIRYDEPGEYSFTCQMGMYRGRVVVR